MDLYKAIRSLYDEKKRLDRLIESLERLPKAGTAVAPAKPRGRRRMNAKERHAVSARMKRYWEARREQKAAAAVAGADSSGAAVPAAAPGPDPAL